jgi:PAT family beta-lactamase induction signal transducer AmpG
MALSNMGRAAGAAMLGVLKTNFNWEIVFLIIALMPVIMVILIQLINFKKHRVTVDSFVILKHTAVAPHVLKD